MLETRVLVVKPDDSAMFLGQKLHGNYQGEVGPRLQKRFPGTRIKHTHGPVTLKRYDQFAQVFRLETTVNDVSFMQQRRVVQHRDGQRETKWATMKKTLYTLPALHEVLQAANRRYLEFLPALERPDPGGPRLHQLTQTQVENDHRHKGFNFFAEADAHSGESNQLFRAMPITCSGMAIA